MLRDTCLQQTYESIWFFALNALQIEKLSKSETIYFLQIPILYLAVLQVYQIPYTGIFSHRQIIAIRTEKHEHSFSQFSIFAVGNLHKNPNLFCTMTFVKI